MRPGRRSVYAEHVELSGSVRERTRLAATWLSSIQRPDGSFPYTYDPVADRYDLRQYNEVRHAGVTYALFQACALIDDRRLRVAAHRAAQYIVDSSITLPAGGAAYVYQGRCKLGGLALAIVALLEGKQTLETTKWDEAIAGFSAFLLALELPDEPGRFHQSYEIATQEKLLTPASNFYPGEALLALVRLHRAFPEGPWLAAAQRAARYLIHIKDGDQIAAHAVPREDHWLAIALSELYRCDPNPEYATIAMMQAARMTENQHGENAPEPWMIGGVKRMPVPSAVSTATQAEALVALWKLARALNDPEWIERIAAAALRSIRFLMRVQYTVENTGAFPQPQRAIGAWAQDATRHFIRIDFVQHGLSALIGAMRMLERERALTPATVEARLADMRSIGQHNRWSTEAVIWMPVHVPAEVLDGDFDIARLRDRIDSELSCLPGHAHGGCEGASNTGPQQSSAAAVGALIGRVAVALQCCLGDRISFFMGAPGSIADEVEVTFGFRYKDVGLAAAELATRFVANAITEPPAPFDLLAEFQQHVAAVHPSRMCWPSTWTVFTAAERRGIAVHSLDIPRQMIALGSGAYGRRYWSMATSRTAHHGVKIAKDKHLASQVLRAAGLPVPRGLLVASAAEALQAANELGFPVVLKPNRGNQGRDVHVEIRDERELAEIGEKMFGGRPAGDWLVEEFIPGHEHRVLVIGGKVAAVNLRMPPEVTGDGVSTVLELITALNTDPRRSFQKGFPMKPVVPGAQHLATLQRQGLGLDSVPAAGRLVRLNSVSNISAGGSTRDVTDSIHPDNARIACMAAAAVGLDISGIDLVVPDIGQSLWETGGAIVEINSNPGLIDHLQPGSGTPRDVGAAIVDMLYPKGQPVRPGIVVVLESDDSAAICRSLGRVLADAGWTVGVASRDGKAIDGMVLGASDGRHPHGISTLLGNPAVEIAVVEISAAAIGEHGLGIDACDAVVLPGPEMEIDRTDLRLIETVLRAALDADRDDLPDAALEAIDQALRTIERQDASTAVRLVRQSQ